jgi:O-acetylserine/cysteine efflux transporter
MKPADFVLLVAVCLFWALNLVITRWAVTAGDVPPLFFAAVRVTLLAAVLAPFLLPAPRQIGMMFVIAMGMAGIHFGLLFLGLATSTAGVAAVIGQLGVPFTTILSIVFLKEQIGIYRTVGILLAFVGVIIIVLFGAVASVIVVCHLHGWKLSKRLGVTMFAMYGGFLSFSLSAARFTRTVP